MTASPLWGLPQGFQGILVSLHMLLRVSAFAHNGSLGGVLPHGSLAGLTGSIFCEFPQVSLLLLDPQVTKEDPEVTVG